MTRVDTAYIPISKRGVAIFSECLIPGFGAAVDGNLHFEDEILPLLQALETAPLCQHIALIRAFEETSPEVFARAYGAVITAYYTAPVTRAVIAHMGAEGPHPASGRFDPRLLEAVIADNRAKSRI